VIDAEIQAKAMAASVAEVVDKLRDAARGAELGGPLMTAADLAILLRLGAFKLEELAKEIADLEGENARMVDRVDDLLGEIEDLESELAGD
jgi:chromosome segregation ATPase